MRNSFCKRSPSLAESLLRAVSEEREGQVKKTEGALIERPLFIEDQFMFFFGFLDGFLVLWIWFFGFFGFP